MVVVNVDDMSSDISYAGDWYTTGCADEYAGTTHGSSVSGATATFKFTGTNVVVYGSVSDIGYSQAPVSTYSIDGGQQWTYVASPGQNNQYRVPFYKSPQLSQGVHTLVIKTTRPSTAFWLDYIQYTYEDTVSAVPSIVLPPPTSTSPQQNNAASTTPSNPASTQTSISGSIQGSGSTSTSGMTTSGQANGGNPTAIYSVSVSTAAGSSPQTTGSGSETPNSDVNSTGVNSSQTSRRGIIAGAVIGSVVLAVIIVVLVWLLMRKRRRESPSSPESLPYMDQAEAFVTVPESLGGHINEGEMRKQAEIGRQASRSGSSFHVGYHLGMHTTSDNVQPPTISAASHSSYHPPVDNDGQPYIVVYQPMPAEAPPSYRLRQSATTFVARDS